MFVTKATLLVVIQIIVLCFVAISCSATSSLPTTQRTQTLSSAKTSSPSDTTPNVQTIQPKSIIHDAAYPQPLDPSVLSQVTLTDGRYQNQVPRYERSFTETASIMWKFLFSNPADNSPTKTIPVNPITPQQLAQLSNDQVHVIRMGHSTTLLKIYGQYWITDPMFSLRASPFKSVGPARFHPTPIIWSALLDGIDLAGVIISHNHYDHLDETSIRQLADRNIPILLPMGVAKTVQSWGVAAEQTIEFNWWDQVTIAGITLTATPSQHFSGRRFSDENKTLWLSWVIKHPQATVFFSGDGGYFSGFKQIGEVFQSIDITLMEAGAYNRHWPDMHLFPEQTVAAHQDLNGQWLVPIHNTTFDLSMHPWQDPMEKIADIAEQRNINALFPQIGQILSFTPNQSGLQLEAPRPKLFAWWEKVMASTD